MYRLIVVILFLSISAVNAEEVIPKVGNKCPSGYSDGKGAYCYNRSNSENKEKVLEKVDGSCPSGYRDGKDNKCPSGYRDGPGHYCYR